MESEKNSRLLLDSMKEIIPIEGWSEDSLRQASSLAGIDDDELSLICPSGVSDAIVLLSDYNDKFMVESKERLPWTTMGTTLKFKNLLEARIRKMSSAKELEKLSIEWLSRPSRSPLLFNLGFNTVDAIWDIIDGHPHKSYTYYSKRVSALAIYSSTIAFWLQDDSKNHSKTFAFLERRLDNHAAFSKFSYRCKQRMSKLCNRSS